LSHCLTSLLPALSTAVPPRAEADAATIQQATTAGSTAVPLHTIADITAVHCATTATASTGMCSTHMPDDGSHSSCIDDISSHVHTLDSSSHISYASNGTALLRQA